MKKNASFGVMVAMGLAAVSHAVANETFSFGASGETASNLVFGAGAGLEVAADASVTALGTFGIGDAAAGDITKTGAGTFTLGTVIPPRTVNGDGANGGAALAVSAGTFAFDTGNEVANMFTGGIAVNGTGTLDVKGGATWARILALNGRSVNVTGGSLVACDLKGPATIGISGGEFGSTNTFVAASAAGDVTRVNVAEGGTLVLRNISAPAGDVLISVDGGTIRPRMSDHAYDGREWNGAAVQVGAKGATVDLSDSYAWGPRWYLPTHAAPGVSDGGLYIHAPGNGYSFRLATDDVALAGGIRAKDVQFHLLGSDYASAPANFHTTVTLEGSAILRVVAGSTTVDRLVFDQSEGYLIYGVFQSGASVVVPCLTVNDFVPPTGIIRLGRMKADTTSDLLMTAGTYDIVKFPASVACDVSRFVYDRRDADYSYRLNERTENGWRIISLTVATSGSLDYGIDPRVSDAWQTGTAPWAIGPWLYVHSAGSLTTAAPLTLTPAQNQVAGISVPEGDALTLAGGLAEAVGGFAKLGAGTLALTGDVGYQFGRAFTSTSTLGENLVNLALFNGASNGAPCANTHGATLTVGRGMLAIGTGADAPVVKVPAWTLNIGTATTDQPAAEGDAELVMNSGYLSVADTLNVGVNHGLPSTRDKDYLVSSYVQNGGTTEVRYVQMCYDNTKVAQSDARFTLNDGAFICNSRFYAGVQSSASSLPAYVRFTQNGGSLSVGHENYVSDTGEGRFIGKYNGGSNMVIDYTMTGGEAMFWKGFSVYNSGTVTVNLNGGRLAFADRFNGGNGTTLNWNGTVMAPQPKADGSGLTYFIVWFKDVNVLEGNAIVDVSALPEIDLNATLKGPGRLVVRGSNTNNVLRLYDGVHNLAGVTIEEGGAVVPRGKSGGSLDFLVKNGGAICNYYNDPVKDLTLGELESDVTVLYGYDVNGSLTSLYVTNSLTVNGTVWVASRAPTGKQSRSLHPGTTVFLRAPKGMIDPAKFALHPDLVARGGAATFSVDTSNAAYDALVATVTSSTVVHTWTANASGAWDDDANWDLPPNGGDHEQIVFPASIPADVVVAADTSSRAKKVDQNAAHTVTVNGPFEFSTVDVNNLGVFDIALTNGVLELAGPVRMLGDRTLKMTRSSKGGTLRISGAVEGAPTISKASGYIEGRPEAFGGATLDLANSILRFTRSGTFWGNITHAASDKTGLGVEVDGGDTVYMTGLMDNSTAFSMLGGGRLVLVNGGANNVGGAAKNENVRPIRDETTGDAPNAVGLSVIAGTLELDGGDDATYRLSTSEVRIGTHPIPDGTGGAYDARLVIRSGTAAAPGLFIGRPSMELFDSPLELGLTRRPYCALDVYGGSLTITESLLMNYSPEKTGPVRYRSDGTTRRWDYYHCNRAELNVHGGEVIIGKALFLPYHDTLTAIDEGYSEANVNVDGGLVDILNGNASIGQYADGYNQYPARGTINMDGGTIRTLATKGVMLCQSQNSIATLNLRGGVLEAGYINRNSTAANTQAHVLFDGGTFKSLASSYTFPNKTLTSLMVGEGGARFDLGDANALTLNQALNKAQDVEADGGIMVTGSTAAATLTLKAANAFNGPLTVNGGTMRPTVAAAASCAAGVEVNNGGVFDANGFGFTFGFLRGEGGVYSNGTVTVTGAVAPSNTTFTVADLVLADGAVLKCPVSGNAAQGWTAPYLTVAGSVAKAGDAFLDLGHDADDPLAKGCRVKVAELAPGVDAFPSLRATGVGLPSAGVALSRQAGADGVTEIWAEVVPSAFMLIFR